LFNLYLKTLQYRINTKKQTAFLKCLITFSFFTVIAYSFYNLNYIISNMKSLFLVPNETITELSQNTKKFVNETVKVVDDVSSNINNLQSELNILTKTNSILYNLLILSCVCMSVFLYYFLEFSKKNEKFYENINKTISTNTDQNDKGFK
jgi:predicted PurR-regulated permease PerM